MSTTLITKVKTYKQEDTTLAKYRLAKLGTSADQVVAAVDASAFIVGATDESADETAGNPVGIPLPGSIVKVTIASATTKGAHITATTGGKGAGTTTDNDYCVGYLLETTTVSNQVAQVLVMPHIYATI